MSEEEYTQTQHTIQMIAGLVADLPLEEFIAIVEQAQAAGPVLDPTRWRQATDNLARLETMADGLLTVKLVALELREKQKGRA